VILDRAAAELNLDPAEIRRINLIPDDAYPWTTASGLKFEKLSHQAALETLLKLMDYDGLRREQAALREKGVYRGIGLASFVELTNPGPAFYGVGGAPISAQDGATIKTNTTINVTGCPKTTNTKKTTTKTKKASANAKKASADARTSTGREAHP